MRSIQSRLTVIFVLGLLITSGLAGFIILKYENLMNSSSRLSENTHRIQNSALKAQVHFKTQVQEWKNILLRGYDEKLYKKYVSSFILYEKKTRDEVNNLLKLSHDYPELKKDALQFIAEHKKLGMRYREALPVYRLSEHNPHITTDKYVRGIDRNPIKLLSKIVENSASIYIAAIKKIDNDFNETLNYIVFVFVITFISLIIFFWFFTKKGISQPLKDASNLLRNIAEGDRDLTMRLDSHNVTELKSTAHWFNVFISNVQQLMTQINAAANNLADASYASAKTNEQTNQAITNQQTAISKVSESMQQMSTNIQAVADNAQLTAESTKSALSATSMGCDIVVETVAEIKHLSDKINNSTEVVRQLADESTEVNAILSTITAIAEQTNLLALNAAIEAARAGEHGRGFAVVADEVRNLSQKTYQATIQIQELVNSMQESSKSAVDTMLESRKQAVKTVDLATSAGISLEKINEMLAKIDIMNKDIADSSVSQSISASDINSTIININGSIANTIGNAQRNTSDSSDLAQLSSLLHMLIIKFKVSDNMEREDLITMNQEDGVELF